MDDYDVKRMSYILREQLQQESQNRRAQQDSYARLLAMLEQSKPKR
jgi:hypothetical protein